jgi:uncharacterized protein with NAD-binding domain and iron-sulfur cluster
MGGLAAAHELIERGFEVTVFEPKALGGKARSMPVPGTGAGGRLPLPGEHGFRFFPGFYRNIPDTMRRTPFPGNRRGVLDNLVGAREASFARANGPDMEIPVTWPRPRDWSPVRIVDSLRGFLNSSRGIRPHELEYFLRKVVVFFSSCDERRYGQWEYTSWWDVVAADRFGDAYRHILTDSLTRNLVAAKADVASALTIGAMGQAFVYALFGAGTSGHADRLLNAPTNEAWIDPWVAHLRSLGVAFELGQAVTGLELEQGRIARAHVRDGSGTTRSVDADWFVLAVPAERAAPLLQGDIAKADPRVARIGELTTDWMTGIQFYLDRKLPIVHGHLSYIDSPWALTSISQAQFWKPGFERRYGDGSVKECLSVDISEWSRKGILYGEPAWHLGPEQIKAEVWAQIKAHLNERGRRPRLTDDMVRDVFLDPAITYPSAPPAPGRIAENDEQLLINTVGSWDLRPEAVTAIPNLALAGDYVRTSVNLATMEGANEAARRGVNGLLEAAGSQADAVRVWDLYQPPEWNSLKQLDRQRYRRRQRNLFDDPGSGAPTRFAGAPQSALAIEVERALSRRW